MRRIDKLLLLVCSLFAASVHAQTSANTIRNSGMCNPVITGGSGPVVIRCSGLSGQKANQLIDLMNRILNEHLDLSEVNTKLDSMGSQLSDINATLNPLAGAPVEIIKLYEQAQTVLLSEMGSSMISGTMVWNENDKRAPSVTLERLSAKGSWQVTAPVTGEGHAFIFKDLIPGSYVLSAHGAGKFISGVRLKGGSIVQKITLPEMGQHVAVELEMSAAGSDVRGRIDSLGQKDVAKARIILRASNGRLAVAPLSRDGSFDFGEQSPGDYLVYGLADAELLPYRNWKF